MPHEILKRLRIHTAFRHVRAKRMPANVGRDIGKRVLVNAVILHHNMFEVMLPVQSYSWLIVHIKKKKACAAVDHGFDTNLFAIFQNAFKAGIHFVRHWNGSFTAVRLWLVNIVGHFPRSLQLMVDCEPALFKIDIVHRKPAQLRDSKSRLEQ